MAAISLVSYPDLTTPSGKIRSGKLLTFFLTFGLECQTANQIRAKAIIAP